MDWLNIHTSVLRSETFLDSTPVNQSVWLRILGYCAAQENGGKIKGCGSWDDKKCLRVLQCSFDEIRTDSRLWTWKGDELRVEFYPKDQEESIRAKRRGAAAGAAARWKKTPQNEAPIVDQDASGNAVKDATGTSSENANWNAIGMTLADAERNGMKGKEGKDTHCALEETFPVSHPNSGSADDRGYVVAPTLEKAVAAASMRGITPECVEKWWHQCDARGWTDQSGQAIRRWESSLQAFSVSWRAVDHQEVERLRVKMAPKNSGISAAFDSERTRVANPRINGLP